MSAKQLLASWLLLLVGAALSLSACASETPSGATAVARTPQAAVAGGAEAASYLGDPEGGLLLFNEYCLECHTATLPRTFIGPTLYQAGERLTADYVRVSIEEPHDAVAAEFTAAMAMPDNFGGQLSDQELADIVAYLMSAKK
ncbi:MAG TPA: cytochrome c [Anaerolineales bacterium]|nr:cytochrome c [Anaerolineales bacterium]